MHLFDIAPTTPFPLFPNVFPCLKFGFSMISLCELFGKIRIWVPFLRCQGPRLSQNLVPFWSPFDWGTVQWHFWTSWGPGGLDENGAFCNMECCSLVLLTMRRRINLEGSVAQVGGRRRRSVARRRLSDSAATAAHCEPPSVATATQSLEIKRYRPLFLFYCSDTDMLDMNNGFLFPGLSSCCDLPFYC